MGKTIRKVHITIEQIKKPTKAELMKGIKPKGPMRRIENIVTTGDDEFLIQCDQETLRRTMRQAFRSKDRKWLKENLSKYRIEKVEMIENGILGETSQ